MRLLQFSFELRNLSIRSISVEAIKLNSCVCSNLSAHRDFISRMYLFIRFCHLFHEYLSIAIDSSIHCGPLCQQKPFDSVYYCFLECYSGGFPNGIQQSTRNYVVFFFVSFQYNQIFKIICIWRECMTVYVIIPQTIQ